MSIQAHFRLAKKLTRLLDSQFSIYGFRFGLDPVIGLFPGIGNWLTTLTSFNLFWLAYRLHVPSQIYLHMILTIIIDALITSIPIAGNIIDFFYKSNVKNLMLLSRYVDGEVLEGEMIN